MHEARMFGRNDADVNFNLETGHEQQRTCALIIYSVVYILTVFLAFIYTWK
jgi:hypothetical protein